MIVYPANIDSGLSRSKGRKISKKAAIDSPKSQEILKALVALEENGPRLEKEKAYPRRWWDGEGRVVVEKNGGKNLLMKRIAKEIRRMRASS